jgi:hypothetical protein
MFFDQQLRFVDKMIAKVHGSILNIHGLVGEKDAQKWLSDAQKATVSTSSKVKTPAKKPRTRTTAASAATGMSGEEASTAGGSGGQGGSGGKEKDFLEETLKTQYVHLMEMDELLREKLFILQVREKSEVTKVTG